MSSIAAEHHAPSARARQQSSTKGRRAALLALVVIALCYLAVIAGPLDTPFGDSYEGRNGGVWGAGSQAIREDGPIASALGARHDSGLVYARHPPLIYPLTATAEWIGGSSPAAIRAPTVLAALATIGLLYVMLRTVGLRRLSSVVGVAVVAGSAMFTVYGPMPDTPMLGLPVGLALMIAWLRRQDDRGLPRGVDTALAAAAALVAWQAVFVALTLAAVDAVRVAPRQAGLQPRRRLRAAGPYLTGTMVGLTITLLWVIWATGGPSHVVDALTERSGAQGGVNSGDIVTAQLSALVDLFGLAALGLVATVVALRTDRYRPVAAITLFAVFGYAALTPTAAAVHDYWLYWAVAPVALGWALAVETTVSVADGPQRPLARVGVGLAALVVVASGLLTTSRAGAAFNAGIAAGELAESLELPDGQEHIPTVGVINQFAAWIPLATGADSDGLTGEEELRRMAADTPAHLLMASTWCATDDGLCSAISGGGGTRTDHDYVLLSAQHALDRVDGS